MNMKVTDCAESASLDTAATVAIASAPTLTSSQLEEALEERVNPDRRKKERKLPEAIVDRRNNERRT